MFYFNYFYALITFLFVTLSDFIPLYWFICFTFNSVISTFVPQASLSDFVVRLDELEALGKNRKIDWASYTERKRKTDWVRESVREKERGRLNERGMRERERKRERERARGRERDRLRDGLRFRLGRMNWIAKVVDRI